MTAGAPVGSLVPRPWQLLLISGSLRDHSTNTAVLRTAAAVAPPGTIALLGAFLAELPHFNPDDDVDPLPAPVAELRGRIHDADAIVVSTPEYAGALPGSFKNLLDWTIDDDQPRSINGKPVAWINASPRKAAGAHASLRTVLGYAGAVVVEEACIEVPVTGSMIGDDGPDRRPRLPSPHHRRAGSPRPVPLIGFVGLQRHPP